MPALLELSGQPDPLISILKATTATPPAALRIANFGDSSLEALDRKGNLSHALQLYNPLDAAEKVVHFTAYPGDVRYAPAFAARRIEVFPFFDRQRSRALAPLTVPAAFLRVLIKIKRERVTVIRGRLPYFGSLLGCLAGRLLRVPTVVSLGGDNRLPQEREGRYYFGSRRLSYAIERGVLRLCNIIIVPNVFTKKYVVSVLGAAAARDKIVVIPWALEPTTAASAQSPVELVALGIKPNQPIVLVVGHLNKYKDSLQMFEVAAALLARSRRSVQVIFCGDGPLRPDGERRLSAFTGAHFLGWQSNRVVLDLIKRAAVVLVPMSGFVLLEAASLGAPVVAANVEWHGEIISPDETGWLVQPDAVSEWVDRVEWILDHPVQALEAGARLRKRFQTAYSPRTSLRREADLYSQLLTR